MEKMKITKDSELQNNFKNGLQIAGEDGDGNLLWMGTAPCWGIPDETRDATDYEPEE